jgi:class 3 adenylate cyclase
VARKKNLQVAVLTADIIQSTVYSRAERQRLNRALLKAFDEVVERYPKAVHKRLTFRITAGDEFQCVFSDIPKTLNISRDKGGHKSPLRGVLSDRHTHERESRARCRLSFNQAQSQILVGAAELDFRALL